MTFGKIKLSTKKFPKRSLYIGLIFLGILAVISIRALAASSCQESELVKDYAKLQDDAAININDNGYLIFKGPIDDVVKINLQKSEGGSQIIYCFDYEDDCPVGCRGVDDVCVLDRSGNILYKDNFFWGHADEIPETRVDVKAGDKLIVEESWWGYLGLEIWKENVCEPEPVCVDNDEDGFSITGGECGLVDCNDENAGIHPGAVESCDWIDNNCDGTTDNNENCVVACSANTDCGINGFIEGLFCQSNDIYQNFKSFLCNLPGTYDSYCSNSINSLFKVDCGEDSCGAFGENYCSSGDVYHSRTCHDKGCSVGSCFDNQSTDEQLVQDCSYGCLAGACLFEPEPPECTQDLDCGADRWIGSPVCVGDDLYQDYQTFTCETDNACIDETNQILKQECSYGCSNDECIDEPSVIECDNNADCDDENALTEDICVNPGEEDSYCTNEPYGNILCSTNNECGTNGWINQPSCSSGNVVQDYKTWTCNNSGTVSSYCSSKQPCQYGCLNGTCLPQPTQCSVDADCNSLDNYSDGYCSSGDVYKDFNDYSCEQGICVKETGRQLDEECDNGCSAGECEEEEDDDDNGEDEEEDIFVYEPYTDGSSLEMLSHGAEQGKIYLAPEEETKSAGSLWWILIWIFGALIILFLILIFFYSRRR